MNSHDVIPGPEPFNPTTDCHPKPEFGGADGCPHIDPCKLRCHIRWLDAQTQPNDDLADQERRVQGVLPAECPDGPHRGPQGPNEDLSQCPVCWLPSHAMRPEGETYGEHLPDCRLPIRHPSFCEPGGTGHPPAATIRGYWPGADGGVDNHA